MATDYSQEYVDENLATDSLALLHKFYQAGELCDVEISVGNKIFPCHRTVLACVSGYFRSMFLSNMAEANQRSISIEDIDEEAMDKLIQFAYTAKISLSTENVQLVLYAASILQIETVANACSRFMQSHLHPTNCIEVRSFAEQHNRVELIKTTDNYIKDNFVAVSLSEEFLSMPFNILLDLLSSPDLNVETEEQVYSAIMRWIGHDPELRAEHLPNILAKVLCPQAMLPAVPPEDQFNPLNPRKNKDQMWRSSILYDIMLTKFVPQLMSQNKCLPYPAPVLKDVHAIHIFLRKNYKI